MNWPAVAASLPPSFVAHLDAYGASEATRLAIARDVATLVGRRVLSGAGEGSWDGEVRRLILDHASPTVRAVVEQLPHGPHERRWSARDVARLVCTHLDLAGADALRRVLREPSLVTEQPA